MLRLIQIKLGNVLLICTGCFACTANIPSQSPTCVSLIIVNALDIRKRLADFDFDQFPAA